VKRFHIALAVADLEASIADYSARLNQPPQVVVADTYAMWRTDLLNFSINRQPERAGQLRHVGFEDDEVRGFTSDADINASRGRTSRLSRRTCASCRPTACRHDRPPKTN
jgi:hypothetical protein